MGHDPKKMRRADQAHSGTTDATRTERGFHAAGNGDLAGRWLFRWAGMGSLNRRHRSAADRRHGPRRSCVQPPGTALGPPAQISWRAGINELKQYLGAETVSVGRARPLQSNLVSRSWFR